MKIYVTSVFVDDQRKALKFYTEILGFETKTDVTVGDGIPLASFQVENLNSEYERLRNEGVTFTQTPVEAGDVNVAVLDDTCGNLIQLIEMIDAT